ncbi:hypothetical protein [Kitasatospora phosalacinea]|uniref:hypothetical protein n=1 Tax=Kitasatospora phosalacinea TaxID=2065 RepID=UPI002553AEE3|nr:hypothetical protein [Kitasatospora phosalacinea]
MQRVDVSLAAALVAAAVLTAVLAAVGELSGGGPALLAFTVLSAVVGSVSRRRAAPAIGLAAWAFFDGFGVHHHAELGWDAGGADWRRLGLFTVAAFAAAVLGPPRRRIRPVRITVPAAPPRRRT